jgi:hypothetical protein
VALIGVFWQLMVASEKKSIRPPLIRLAAFFGKEVLIKKGSESPHTAAPISKQNVA